MTNLDFSTPNVVFAYYLQCESLQKLHKQYFSQEINIFRIVYKIKEKKTCQFWRNQGCIIFKRVSRTN